MKQRWGGGRTRSAGHAGAASTIACATALCAGLCSSPRVVRAEDSPPAPAGAVPGPAPERTSPDVGPAPGEPPLAGETAAEAERRARAKELFERGKAAYEAGQFATALEAWQECYALARTAREQARALWILAQAQRKSGQCERARETYAAYLESPAGDEAREEARAWLERLALQCPRPAQPPPAAPVPAPPAAASAEPLGPAASGPDDSEARATAAPWLVWSVFSAAAAAAVASGVSASAAHQEKEEFLRLGRNAPGRLTPEDSAAGRALGDELAAVQRRGQRYDTMAWVFAGSAVVFSGVGVALLLLPEERRSKESSWSFAVTPHGGIAVGCSAAF
jgi:tetratricopeptide (TPR) repeat protein